MVEKAKAKPRPLKQGAGHPEPTVPSWLDGLKKGHNSFSWVLRGVRGEGGGGWVVREGVGAGGRNEPSLVCTYE
jgi:hypothetical protein